MTSAKTFLQDESGAAAVDVSVVLAIVVVTLGVALVIRAFNFMDIIARLAAVFP